MLGNYPTSQLSFCTVASSAAYFRRTGFHDFLLRAWNPFISCSLSTRFFILYLVPRAEECLLPPILQKFLMLNASAAYEHQKHGNLEFYVIFFYSAIIHLVRFSKYFICIFIKKKGIFSIKNILFTAIYVIFLQIILQIYVCTKN